MIVFMAVLCVSSPTVKLSAYLKSVIVSVVQ